MAHLPEKILVLVFALTLPSVVIWKINTGNKVLGATVVTKKDYTSEISFWQRVVSNNPDYRDGYLQLAILYKKSGNLAESRQRVQQALRVDPNLVLPPQLADLQ